MRKFLKSISGGEASHRRAIRNQDHNKTKPVIVRPPTPGPPDGFVGEWVYENGDRAEGHFVNGKLNGEGKYIANYKPKPALMEGTFREGKLHGPGKKDYYGLRGGQFEGGYLSYGRITYPPNDRRLYYEGEFLIDDPNGHDCLP
jgi:hypothetical protein